MFDSWSAVKYLYLEICDEGECFQGASPLALFFISFIPIDKESQNSRIQK